MELWDILDEKGNKTGRTMVRGNRIKRGDYHLVVHIWAKNEKGEYLIQKRAKTRRQDFADIYLLTQPVDVSALVLQKEEVEAVKWASREEITEMVQSGAFHNYGKEYFDLLFSV